MVASRSLALHSNTSEYEKRQRIRSYFRRQELKWPLVCLGMSWILTYSSLTQLLGWIFLIASAIWLVLELLPVMDTPGDKTIDAWHVDDMTYLKKRSLERLRLNELDRIQQSVILQTPILWETNAIAVKELTWRKGQDGQMRFGIHTVTMIYLLEHRLECYQCDYDFTKGVPFEERIYQFHYDEVVSASTRNMPTNYTLPNGIPIRIAQYFEVLTSDGQGIRAIVSSTELLRFTGGRMPETGLDEVMKALHLVLLQKDSRVSVGIA